MFNQSPQLPAAPIPFGLRLAQSSRFDGLFQDGMGLVEDTAAYLDGPGREEARDLPRLSALAYASESMRLTTRLMQVASWLLLQRAVKDGEMTQAEALADRQRIRIQRVEDAVQAPYLPSSLQALVDRSLRLVERVTLLDQLIDAPEGSGAAGTGSNPLDAQMRRLEVAFTR